MSLLPERRIVLPRPELQPFVRNLMLGGFGSLHVHLPASADPQLVIYLQGGATLLRDNGAGRTLPLAFVSGPLLLPRRFQVEPGSRFLSATFQPSGFFHCFGIPVNHLAADVVPLDALMSRAQCLPLLEALQDARSDCQLLALLEDFLLAQRRLRKREPPYLPPMPAERILLTAGELASDLDLSTRQFERRFLMHYGVALRDYRRLARFSLALSVLMRAPPGGRSLAAVSHEAGFVDQSHFTRDFREFVGDTPSRFVKTRFERESGYRFWQFDRDELRAFVG